MLCIEPVEHLAQLLPTLELRERVEYGENLLGNDRSLRFTNALGTDCTYKLGDYGVIAEYGYSDTPGRWDHWPSGFLFTGGADDGVDGKVVLAPGDIIFPFKSYVQTPVEITIERGRIVDIRGQLDADLLSEYMRSFRDEKAYGIAHIGWGLNQNARWSFLATDRRGLGMHGRSFYGNVLFSTGPNQEFGGGSATQCHVDIPMRNCSLFLDDEPIVVDGDIVVPEMQAAGPRARSYEERRRRPGRRDLPSAGPNPPTIPATCSSTAALIVCWKPARTASVASGRDRSSAWRSRSHSSAVRWVGSPGPITSSTNRRMKASAIGRELRWMRSATASAWLSGMPKDASSSRRGAASGSRPRSGRRWRAQEAELLGLLRCLDVERAPEPLGQLVGRGQLGLLVEGPGDLAPEVEDLRPAAVGGLDDPVDRGEVEPLRLHVRDQAQALDVLGAVVAGAGAHLGRRQQAA